MILYIILSMAGLYILLTLFFTYMLHQVPRRPVKDPPDWGRVTDTFIVAADGGYLELWKIEPDGDSAGTVVFAHGWGRNRDRMVPRARLFGQLGYTAVIYSARDHGNSSPKRCMNAYLIAQDIISVLEWVDEPVILYGHSAGSVGAIMAAQKRPDLVKGLILEACYADAKTALKSLYCWVNPVFGYLFADAVLLVMDRFLYKGGLLKVSPERIAPHLKMPVLIVHGESDRRFPVAYAKRLHAAFDRNAALFIAKGARHSTSSRSPGYLEAVRDFIQRNELSS